MIETKNICYAYKHSGFGIKDINIEFNDGYYTTLLGKNGAGKTTLLKILYKLISAKSGGIYLDNQKIDMKNLYEYRKAVAFVDDTGWCREGMTLKENVELFSIMYENFDADEFAEYINSFELNCNLDEKFFNGLSKGEKMKFLIAFALARNPRYLIMDEPFTNLDPVVKTDLIEAIHRKVMEKNMGVLMSTHLVEDVSDITDYVIVLEDGKIKLSGDRDEIMTDRNIVSLRELLIKMPSESEVQK